MILAISEAGELAFPAATGPPELHNFETEGRDRREGRHAWPKLQRQRRWALKQQLESKKQLSSAAKDLDQRYHQYGLIQKNENRILSVC